MLRKQTVRDIDIANRIVLVREDYNVPLSSDGQIVDDYRIRESLPTLNYLRQQNCRIVIISHIGRPGGTPNPSLSLAPIAQELGELLGIDIHFLPVAIGALVEQAVKMLPPSGVIMLENLRFYPGEEANDREFAKQLAEPMEYFVQDGFSVLHRAHASTVGVAEFLPSVAGFLVEKEINALSNAIEHPTRPLVSIIGGSKISDKIELINRFILESNTIIIGGAMANTFLKASGYKIGKSVYDKSEISQAKKIISNAQRAKVELVLPLQDVAVGKSFDVGAERRDIETKAVERDDMILDFGPKSLQTVLDKVEHAGTVIWNGPIGVNEIPQFAVGSETLAKFIAQNHINCVVGGGDTTSFVHRLGLGEEFAHVSTGGGASLELLSGKNLPGVDVLLDK